MGYDDISEIQYLTPALTTIRVPKEEIGRTMASELLHLRGRPRRASAAGGAARSLGDCPRFLRAPRKTSDETAFING